MAIHPDSALEAHAHCSTGPHVREFLDNPTGRGRGRLASHGHIALHRAIESNNLDVASALLERPEIQVNLPVATTRDGSTALHVAVLLRDKRVAGSILNRRDLDPNVANNRGETPLHLASSHCPDILELLVSDPRVDVAALTFQRQTALHVACKMASKAQALDIVRKLLRFAETSARMSLTEFVKKQDVLGRTALHHAAENGFEEAVGEILEMSANTDHLALVQDNEHCIALHFAAERGCLRAVQRLLLFGDSKDGSRTAIHHAIRSGREDIVKACLTAKCCLLPENTALEKLIHFYLELLTVTTHHNVAMHLQERLYETLTLNHVAKNNMVSHPSLLHYAVKVDDAHGLIGHILRWQPEKANAPLDADTQQTPLHIATLLGNYKAVLELCKDGAPWHLNGNEMDAYNGTALDYAFETLNEPIQHALMERSDVQRHIARLHKIREAHATASNAVLVVSALIASLTFVKCLTRQAAADEIKAQSGQPLELRIVNTVVSTRIAFMLAITATILAAFAALPFSVGLFFVHTVDDQFVRTSTFRTRVLIVLASYCLTWSLFVVTFAFLCSQYISPYIRYRCELACEVIVGLFIVLSLACVAANLVRFWSKLRKSKGRRTLALASRRRTNPDV